MWSSIRFSADPSWPTSVYGFASDSGTRTGSSTSPRANGRSATLLAVCATRRNGASARRMMTTPAIVAAASAISVTIPKMTSIRNIVASTVGHRQAGDDDVAPAAAWGGDDAVAAEAVEVQGHRLAAAGDPFQLGLGGRSQGGPGAAAGQVAGVDGLAVADHRGHHAGRLARGVEEPRPGAGSRIVGVRSCRQPGRFGSGYMQRRAVRRPGKLPVELRHQVMKQRQFGRRADADADDGEHDDLPDQQPQPKRPDSPRA